MFHKILFHSNFPFTQASPLQAFQNRGQRNKQAICFLLLICFFVNQAFSQPYQEDEMQDLGAFAMSNDWNIDFWEVTMKEQMAAEEAQHLVQQLEATYTLQEDKDENRIKYTFESRHKEDPFYVIYNVILPVDKEELAEVIVVMHGTDWNNQISQKYQKEKRAVQKNYLTKETQLYTCLSIQDSDIMNHDVILNEAATYFNIEHISTKNDNIENSRIEKSTYGYTKTWEQFYFMENDPKNVQITTVADRQGEKSFMIGTPILINEY
ncbi:MULTISPECIES: YwmB family TATA-box binding protein [Oceanobacillus]|uniref:YwmB family TATA-box binding protein n=1 Tax=Oceanobacillus TaxID=182709 RepID=UPI0025A3B266|nr:YwmB family TATA-box binding protein [Oceanobacillus oncorhynchi]MDM8102840.1 YwmB family TATA-box binding protein [Oceanobacillus oncorhynchi]